MTFQRLLVPVDYSEYSRAALRMAGILAQSFGASIDVVHAWDKPTYVSDAVLVTHGSSQRPLSELIRENAEHDMQEFMSTVELPAGLVHRERLLSGDPASALIAEIAKDRYDLVVIGTHGRSGLAHLLLGSVAEKLVRHARIPVLTVPLPH